MTFSKKLGEYLCERCDYSWKPKAVNGEFFEPRSCAKCKSKVWNQPRKYNLGNLASALKITKRSKPTGRAARKLKTQSKNDSGFVSDKAYQASILRQKIGACLPKLEEIPARKSPITPVKDWRYYENGVGRAKKYKSLDDCLADAEKHLKERENRFCELNARLKAPGFTKDDYGIHYCDEAASNINLVVNHITARKADINAVLKEMGKPTRYQVEESCFQIKWRECDFSENDVFQNYTCGCGNTVFVLKGTNVEKCFDCNIEAPVNLEDNEVEPDLAHKTWTAFEFTFLGEMHKLQDKQNSSSGNCKDWWRSRFGDFVGKYRDEIPFEQYKAMELTWETIWERHQTEITRSHRFSAERDFKKNDCGVFTEPEIMVIAETKNFHLHILLATENGIWYPNSNYEKRNHYGGGGLPSTNKYFASYKSRNEAIKAELRALSANWQTEVSEAAKEYLSKMEEEHEK